MASEPLNRIYANEMQNHPYGYALYQPVFKSVIKPGQVGFFDKDGFFSPLASLTDPESLKAAGLKPPKHALSPAPPQDQTWGPMTSKSVSGQNLDVTAGTDPALTGLPITASLQIKYTSSSSFGAVLVTSPPVTHDAFYYTSPFAQWVADNARALLSGDFADDIHAHGLVVVTQTYTTAKCSLTAWTDAKSEVFLGFDAGVKGVGEVKPQGGWSEGNSANGWQKYEAEGGQDLVVFVGGLWYDCLKDGVDSWFRSDARGHATFADVVGTDKTLSVTNASGEKFELKGSMKGGKLAKDDE